MESYDLSAYLAPAGMAPGIGSEKTRKLSANVALFTSPHGSYRYVYYDDGSPVSVVQVVAGPGSDSCIVTNVYTVPSRRRTGLTRKLMKFVHRHFNEVTAAPEHLRSKDGGAWVEKMFTANKRIRVRSGDVYVAAKHLADEIRGAVGEDAIEEDRAFGSLGITFGDIFDSGRRIIRRLDLAERSLNVVVSFANKPKFSGYVISGSYISDTITVVLNGSKRVSEVSSPALVDDIAYLLRHELTHAFDPRTAKTGPSYDSKAVTRESVEYVNDLSEVKALTNQLVEDVRGEMTDIGCYSTDEAECREHLASLLAMALSDPPFSIMNRENQRRVVKDVYLAFFEDD